MTCYVHILEPANNEEFALWQRMGYIGTFEDYAEGKAEHIGQKAFMCGDLDPHCADCSDFGNYLCDYPVGDGKTCDRSMCRNHAAEIAPEIHYCAGHHKLWTEFKATGGVNKSLENIIAYKAEK